MMEPIRGGMVRAGVLQEDVNSVLPFPAQMMNQVHGTEIVEVQHMSALLPNGDALLHNSDALVTRVPGLRLMVKTADCIPLVMADCEAGWVAAVHAGWRGLTAEIVPKVLAFLQKKGCHMERIKVGIGPSLGLCCSIFSQPYQEIPKKYHWAIREPSRKGRGTVDLNAILEKQLEQAGIVPKNVDWMKVCTACSPDWFSWRRDQTSKRFGTWIEIKK